MNRIDKYGPFIILGIAILGAGWMISDAIEPDLEYMYFTDTPSLRIDTNSPNAFQRAHTNGRGGVAWRISPFDAPKQ